MCARQRMWGVPQRALSSSCTAPHSSKANDITQVSISHSAMSLTLVCVTQYVDVMKSEGDVTATHRLELRRGTVVLACLTVLEQPGYGYRLLETLAEYGVAVDANTLYPLLRRLEKQGLLTSEWNTDEARPRKFYRTSAEGRALAMQLMADWEAIHASLTRLRGETS